MSLTTPARPARPRIDGSRIAYLLLLALLCYVALLLAGDVTLPARAALMRVWALLATAVFAVAVPHVLLPAADAPLLQLLNRPPQALLRHQLRPWVPVVLLFALPCVLLAFYDPGRWAEAPGRKALILLEGLTVVLGMGLYSFYRYMTIGQVSQAWQEGRRGGWYRRLKENTTTPLVLPDGLVPALLATSRLFIAGVLVIAAEAYTGRLVAVALGWVPGLVLLAWAGGRLLQAGRAYDRHFYSTNAFYTEIFRSAGGVRASEQEPIPYRAVYWVPRRWRPHAWAGLRQLDRKLPLGRLVALGHCALWILFYQDAAAEVVAAYLLLLITAQNAVVYLLAAEAFAPLPFQVLLQSPAGWTLTRFFINLRWAFPLLLSLGVVALFEASFALREVLLWTALDVLAAWLTAFAATFRAEMRYHRRFA